ncbi:hypothetical protein, partial [Acidovorax sp. ST3]|uniref:hypothetical protein n=1 Tax=Acidovorax sp. ST3 TaxID=2219062 RepID=UPI00193C9AC9
VVLSTSSKELGTRHQTPTLIGCIFLKTPQNKSDQNLLYFANLTAISEALNSSTVFEELSKLSFFFAPSWQLLQLAATTSTERSLVFYTGF